MTLASGKKFEPKEKYAVLDGYILAVRNDGKLAIIPLSKKDKDSCQNLINNPQKFINCTNLQNFINGPSLTGSGKVELLGGVKLKLTKILDNNTNIFSNNKFKNELISFIIAKYHEILMALDELAFLNDIKKRFDEMWNNPNLNNLEKIFSIMPEYVDYGSTFLKEINSKLNEFTTKTGIEIKKDELKTSPSDFYKILETKISNVEILKKILEEYKTKFVDHTIIMGASDTPTVVTLKGWKIDDKTYLAGPGDIKSIYSRARVEDIVKLNDIYLIEIE